MRRFAMFSICEEIDSASREAVVKGIGTFQIESGRANHTKRFCQERLEYYGNEIERDSIQINTAQ